MTDLSKQRASAGLISWLGRYGLAAALVGLVVLRLPWLRAVIERDEGLFAYVGWLWADGGMPYVDVVDHHGLSLYALWGVSFELFGTTVIPMRLLVLGLHVLMVWAVYRLARMWFGQVTASVAALLLALFAALPIFEGHYAMTEPLSTPLVVFGLLAYEQSRRMPDGGRWGWYVAAWMLITAASSIRLIQAMAGVALCGVVIVDTLRGGGRFQERVRLLIKRGGVAALVVGCIWGGIFGLLYGMGALGAFWRILLESFAYGTQASYITPALRGVLLKQGLPLFGLVLLGIVVMLLERGRWQRSYAVIAWWVLLYGWVVTRPQMYGHYFFQLVPFGALLGAVGLRGCYRYLARVSYSHREMLLSACVGLLWLPGLPLVLQQYPNMHLPQVDYYYADSISYSQQQALARMVLGSLDTRADRVYVYGNEPAIYWLVRRRAPVSDTFAINHYRWIVHAHGDTPPLAIVRHPRTDVVVLYERYGRGALDDVAYFVTQQYERVGQVGEATVYRRSTAD